MPLLPISIDGKRLQPRHPLAGIGEHTYEVMREFGYSDAQIDAISHESPRKSA